MLTNVVPLSNPQRVADWLVRSAHAGTYQRSSKPYPTFGADRPAPSLPLGGGSDLSPDYLPEMADCRGY